MAKTSAAREVDLNLRQKCWEFLQQNPSYSECSKKFGVPRSTLYHWFPRKKREKKASSGVEGEESSLRSRVRKRALKALSNLLAPSNEEWRKENAKEAAALLSALLEVVKGCEGEKAVKEEELEVDAEELKELLEAVEE